MNIWSPSTQQTQPEKPCRVPDYENGHFGLKRSGRLAAAEEAGRDGSFNIQIPLTKP
jgi:hypothetical protein